MASKYKQEYNRFCTIDNPIIFDIGSHWCEDSIQFRGWYPKSTIYAFEGKLENVERCQFNADVHNINLFNLAMSDKKDKMTFYVTGSTATGSSSLIEPNYEHYDKHNIPIMAREVQCTTIQDFTQENNIDHIDIIHMDAQAAEYKILSRLGNFRPKIIYAETDESMLNGKVHKSYGVSVEKLNNLLKSFGYRVEEKLMVDTLYIHEDCYA